MKNRPDLREIFRELNDRHFQGGLEEPQLHWNSRLRVSAGRFYPGTRSRWVRHPRKPLIEIASYLLEEKEGVRLVEDTLGHEMIHFWLWQRRRPYGHTPEFYQKMEEMGVSRYNTVPRQRPLKYAYECPECKKEVLARKKLGALACANCCKKHHGGYYHPKYRLVLSRELNPS